jgi:hypothetical protein
MEYSVYNPGAVSGRVGVAGPHQQGQLALHRPNRRRVLATPQKRQNLSIKDTLRAALGALLKAVLRTHDILVCIRIRIWILKGPDPDSDPDPKMPTKNKFFDSFPAF